MSPLPAPGWEALLGTLAVSVGTSQLCHLMSPLQPQFRQKKPKTSSQHHDRLLLAAKPPWPQMLQPPCKSRAGFCLRTSWRLRERRHMPGEGTPAKGGKGGSSWA